MSNKHKIIFLISLVIIPPILIVLSHEFFPNNYFFSSIYKIIFLAPILFGIYVKKESFKQSLLGGFSFSNFKKNFLKVFGLGLVLSVIYYLSFYFLKDFIDIAAITEKINKLASINKSNIIFIGLYIVIFNSLLEEYFWRAFIFDELEKTIKPSLAYAISAIAFSFHHVVFFYNWFSSLFFVLATIGLIGNAIIMNCVWIKYKELFSCWLPHAMVDVIQIFIAYQVFVS